MSSREQLKIFTSVFNGRRDIFAKHYRSKTGRSGYSPACHNEWKDGICLKLSKKPCKNCQSADYIQLLDKHLIDHFHGRHILGIYLLLPDSTCHVLAADFDDHNGNRNPLQDARAFVEACELQDLPVYLERQTLSDQRAREGRRASRKAAAVDRPRHGTDRMAAGRLGRHDGASAPDERFRQRDLCYRRLWSGGLLWPGRDALLRLRREEALVP